MAVPPDRRARRRWIVFGVAVVALTLAPPCWVVASLVFFDYEGGNHSWSPDAPSYSIASMGPWVTSAVAVAIAAPWVGGASILALLWVAFDHWRATRRVAP